MAQLAPTQDEVQAAIGRVRGIVANRVVLSDGAVKEIHVLADADRTAKQIVRDIESVCAAEFGLRIDHRAVSVALIEQPRRTEAPRRRPEIVGVRMETAGAVLSVTVMLSDGNDVFEGSAEGPSFNRQRLCATAAVTALESYMRGTCRLVLDDLVPFHLGEWDGFLVGVAFFGAYGEEKLVGSSLVRKDASEAVIRAVCDALNRRVSTT